MKRSMFVVVVLMAALAYGSDNVHRAMDFNAKDFAGPVCLPGDPCGPWPGGHRQVVPNAWNLMGPVCYPGDPCGSGGGAWNGLRPALRVANFAGPVCYPGDPCGSGGKPISKVLAEQ